MTAIVFDGEKEAKKREEVLEGRIRSLPKKLRLRVYVFEGDRMGLVYSRLKGEMAERLGVGFEKIEIRNENGESRIDNEGVNGVIIQKPSRLTAQELGIKNYESWWNDLIEKIDPKKDVDCLTRENLDKVYKGKSDFVPATVRAVLSILDITHSLRPGLRLVVVGRSELVGKPLAAVLEKRGNRVEILGSDTKDISDVILTADVVISATGKTGLIKDVKDGVVVIDVGEPKGDVDFERVREKARFITPVPGGVGPMTVVSLFENLVSIL